MIANKFLALLNKNIDLIKKNESMFLLFLATLLGQILFFIASPYLVEKYGTEGIGLFALAFSIVAVGGSLSAFKIESLIAIEGESKIALQLASASLLSIFGLGLISMIALYFLPKQLGVFDKALCYIILLSTVFQACANVLTALATRGGHFRSLAANRFLNFGAIGIFSVLLPSEFMGDGLIFSILISICLQLIILCGPLGHQLKSIQLFNYQRKTVDEVRSAVIHLFPASAFDIISQQLPIFIISAAFGTSVLGMYSLASRIIYAPFASVTGSASLIFTNRFSQASFTDKLFIILGTWRKIAIFSVPLYLAAFIFSPYAFSWLYGVDWSFAGEMARPLSILVLVNIIFSTTSIAFIVMGMRTMPIKLASMALVYRIFSFWFGYYVENIIVGLYMLAFFEVIQILIANKLLLGKLSSSQSAATNY